jgi:hypothetical protein
MSGFPSQARGLRAVRAFSSEVDSGSREENASKKDGAPFRFNRNGKGSSHAQAIVRPGEAVQFQWWDENVEPQS